MPIHGPAGNVHGKPQKVPAANQAKKDNALAARARARASNKKLA